MKYLIWGIWSQPIDDRQTHLAIYTTTGVRVIATEGFGYHPYVGVIWEMEKMLVGEMTDPLGASRLYEIIISPAELSFIKEYYGGVTRPLKYQFRKEGDLWVGRYSNFECNGDAQCILQEQHQS